MVRSTTPEMAHPTISSVSLPITMRRYLVGPSFLVADWLLKPLSGVPGTRSSRYPGTRQRFFSLCNWPEFAHANEPTLQ
eukprot:COSAG05_NODE_908_length_6643_cov_2.923441_5_plen_79_part_00